MIKIKRPPTEGEANAVTDIRRVRELLSAECGNDVFRLGQHVRAIADRYRSRLGLKAVRVAEPEASGNATEPDPSPSRPA